MKKIYLLLSAFVITIAASAQVDINFDNMVLGDAVGQDPSIVLWPDPTVTSSQVSDEQANSGANSMVTREQDGTNLDDVLINLGNKNSGVWSVTWDFYVPAGKTGFWNMQNDETFMSTAEAQWNGQFFIGATASGGTAGAITFDQDPGPSAPYPEDAWFTITHVFDLDASPATHTLDINGTTMLDAIEYQDTGGLPATQIGAINYFAIDADNRYYVDNFRLVEGNLLSTDDFSATNFSVYPNPVQNILNIRSAQAVSNVAIFDVLGKEVMNINPNTISPQVDMSTLSSGAYFVRVSINGASKTVKVIK